MLQPPPSWVASPLWRRATSEGLDDLASVLLEPQPTASWQAAEAAAAAAASGDASAPAVAADAPSRGPQNFFRVSAIAAISVGGALAGAAIGGPLGAVAVGTKTAVALASLGAVSGGLGARQLASRHAPLRELQLLESALPVSSPASPRSFDDERSSSSARSSLPSAFPLTAGVFHKTGAAVAGANESLASAAASAHKRLGETVEARAATVRGAAATAGAAVSGAFSRVAALGGGLVGGEKSLLLPHNRQQQDQQAADVFPVVGSFKPSLLWGGAAQHAAPVLDDAAEEDAPSHFDFSASLMPPQTDPVLAMPPAALRRPRP